MGFGQFYNKSYWKIPIIYGLAGYFVYEIKQNDKSNRYYRGLFSESVKIPRNIKLSEAPSHGKPILLYDAKSPGEISYAMVAEEIIRRNDKNRKIHGNSKTRNDKEQLWVSKG